MARQEPSKGEACCWCLSHCCIVYGIFGIVLMTWFGILIKNESVTFKIAKAKDSHPDDWKFDEKATAMFTGAGLYAVTLLISILSRWWIAKKRASQYSAM
eukprot:TRINITY_DN24306_c0_g1_i1.p1 TRINITY_DN24306_c0_g1~~TRINITY_DN24306_c0_g1_i1.p1  ORF type:complete len:100 (+),score=14.74 TRINITY_DN24306_c0_g1_i1:58-357(+)